MGMILGDYLHIVTLLNSSSAVVRRVCSALREKVKQGQLRVYSSLLDNCQLGIDQRASPGNSFASLAGLG